MVKIGDIELCGNLTLAPMAGVTDFAFRRVCRGLGAALTTTEMVSAKALVYKDEKTKSLLYIPEDEHPCAAQIFGHEPDVMAEAAVMAREISGVDIIDINMGCPVGKVVKSGDGSALMRTPELAEEIIRSVVKSAGCPVTVKFRKGWDNGSVNAVDFARMCEVSGAAAVAVHGRTRAQMYAGRADWDIIREVRKAVSIPGYTGCELAMIGRGSFGNPWLFRQGQAAIDGEDIPPLPPLSERIDMAVAQIEELAAVAGERNACMEARHQLPWYLHGVAHSGYYKQQLVHVDTLEDIRKIAIGIKHDLT